MSLSDRQIAKLEKIITMAQSLLETANDQNTNSPRRNVSKAPRTRRTAAQTQKLRNDVLKARARGASVAELAEKFNVSAPYIYMLK
jgi:hypothetical protein